MEIDGVTISEILGLMLGGCGIGSLFTIKYTRRQARGEARSAENEATKAVQDVYQEMIEKNRSLTYWSSRRIETIYGKIGMNFERKTKTLERQLSNYRMRSKV